MTIAIVVRHAFHVFVGNDVSSLQSKKSASSKTNNRKLT